MSTNVISLHPASFGRRRDLAAPPPLRSVPLGYVDAESFAAVTAERTGCGWPVLPANVEVMIEQDGRLTVRPAPREPVVIPADAPSPIDWAPRRGFIARFAWAVRLARLFGRA